MAGGGVGDCLKSGERNSRNAAWETAAADDGCVIDVLLNIYIYIYIYLYLQTYIIDDRVDQSSCQTANHVVERKQTIQ